MLSSRIFRPVLFIRSPPTCCVNMGPTLPAATRARLLNELKVLWGLDGSGDGPPRVGQHHVRSLVIRPERVDRQCPLVCVIHMGFA